MANSRNGRESTGGNCGEAVSDGIRRVGPGGRRTGPTKAAQLSRNGVVLEVWQVAPEWGGPDEVHVWTADLEAAKPFLDRYRSTLAPGELERASRFYLDRHRDGYVVVHGILRDILGRYLGQPAQSLEFSYGRRGKPRLARSPLSFNLSDSDGLALYAVARGREVGVDVERHRRFPDLDGMAKLACTSRERDNLLRLAEPGRTEAFFDLWTRKEALVKAVGVGLFQGLDEFEVSLAPREIVRLPSEEEGGEVRDWTLLALDTAPGYSAALAASGGGLTLVRLDYAASPA